MESKCKDKEIRNIRESGNVSHDRIPLLGLSSSEVRLCGIQYWSRFVGISFRESINCFTPRMEFSRFPVRHIITNPFNQILEFAAVYVGV
jgi:hypothetical protein